MAPGQTFTSTKALKVDRPQPDPKGFELPKLPDDMKETLQSQINAWVNKFGLNLKDYISKNQWANYCEHLFVMLLNNLPEDFFKYEWTNIVQEYIKDNLRKVSRVLYYDARRHNVLNNIKHMHKEARRRRNQIVSKKKQENEYNFLFAPGYLRNGVLSARNKELTGAEKLNFDNV